MSVLHDVRIGHVARSSGGSMPVIEHMQELRRRMLISIITAGVGIVVGYIFFPPVFHWITKPYCDLPKVRREGGGSCKLYTFGVLDPFKVRLNISLYVGILATSPIWLWQMWAFITPGLHRHERRWASTFVGLSVALFGAGIAVAYLTLGNGLGFLLTVGGKDITTLVSVNTYLSYFTAMALVFGLAFEFPLLLLMLNFAGIVTSRKMRSWWRPMVFGITVFAAIATPSQDPYTMAALAVPMTALYFIAIGVTWLTDRRRAAGEPR